MAIDGSKIRQARKAAGLSQSQLATKIGAHFTSVSDWERGENQPSARHLVSIAAATGTTVEALAGGDDEEEPDQPMSLDEFLSRRVEAAVKAALARQRVVA